MHISTLPSGHIVLVDTVLFSLPSW